MYLSRRSLLKYGFAGLPLGLVTVVASQRPTTNAHTNINAILPPDWIEVWSDHFRSLSLRMGGPSYNGLSRGSGTWSASAPWYGRNEPKGWEGFGYDWFVDPSYPNWPSAYPKLGQFSITPDGLQIRAEPASPEMAALLPRVRGVIPWMSGQLNSFQAVRIKPPFYFSCRARMPAAVGTPWPAIWLMTGARRPWPNDVGQEFEIDVHEGFGDDDKLHATVHWHEEPRGNIYLAKTVVEHVVAPLLLESFNTWGALVMSDRIDFVFNDTVVGSIEKPKAGLLNQYFGIILNVSAGLPWSHTLPQGGPHVMTVSEVRLSAPDRNGLTLNGL